LLPDLDLELGIEAEPLIQLFYNDEVLDWWLKGRQAYLEEKLTPDPPAASGPPNLALRWMEAADFGGERREFQQRLGEHLRICRQRLLDNVLGDIVRSGHDAVAFVVRNPTQEPIEGVRVQATFNAANLYVLASAPLADPMPQAPRWPDPLAMARGWELDTSNLIGRPHPPVTPGVHANIRVKDGFAHVTCQVGNLLPLDTRETLPIFIIPQIGVEVEELEIAVTAAAMTRRGVKQKNFAVKIESLGFAVDDVVDPRY
jgi:hypothetical protein